jgi:trk system potassium uptake protein TrkH
VIVRHHAAARATGPLAVDVGGALRLVGRLLVYLSPAFLVPAVFAAGYGEQIWPYLAAGAITAAAGLLLMRVPEADVGVSAREGFLVVTLVWVVVPAFGALPYVFSGSEQLNNLVDAYFESMSGFTTTGATILADIDALPRSLLMWRQFTQWLGGMGIVVLAIAVLPRLRIGGRQLLQNELGGPTEIERLATSIRETARRLWGLYVALTGIVFGILVVYGWTGVDGRMKPFEALAHAFTTVALGGFSTEDRSLEGFAAASQWTIAFFLAVAGINFLRLYRVFVQRQPRAVARDDEFRLYLLLLALGALILFAELLGNDRFAGEAAIRHAVFQAVSIMTCAGFVTSDYTLWGPLAATTIVALMFTGGSAGSTSGSIKVIRHLMVGRLLRRELAQTVHPELVRAVRYNDAVVDERVLRSVLSFVLLYVGIFALGSIAIAVESFRTATAATPFEALSAAASTLGNVGPAFGFAGPMGSFDLFSEPSKLIMTGLMCIGRVEILPVVVLFFRSYWRS